MIKGYNPYRFFIYPKMLKPFKAEHTNRVTVGTFHSYIDWLSHSGLSDYFEKYKYNKDYINNSVNAIITAFNDKNIRKKAGFWAHCWAAMTLKKLGIVEKLDVDYMIDYMQSNQLHDGGFISFKARRDPSSTNYEGTWSEMNSTWYAVSGLDALNAKPVDIDAVKDFVYGLMVVNKDDESKVRYDQSYSTEFRRGETGGGEFYALLILTTLGFDVPNREKFFTGERFDDFLNNYQNLEQKDIFNNLASISYNSYFSLEDGEKYRSAAREIAYNYFLNHKEDENSLKASQFKRDNHLRLMKIIYRLGLGKPKANFHLCFNSYDLTQLENTFELKIDNTSPLLYDIQLKAVEIFHEKKNIFSSNNFQEKNITLKPEVTTKVNFNLNQTSESVKQLKNVKEIKMKLVFDAPIADLYQYKKDYLEYNCEVFFDLPIKS